MPKPPDFYAIGTTGASVAVPIVVESSGKEGDTFARLYVNGTLYDWREAGKGHGRGYNLLALEPTSGEVLDWQVFDTHRDDTANSAMLTWVEGLADCRTCL